jgi:tRNA(Ile)-lysidine synthase TilS/MesJ
MKGFCDDCFTELVEHKFKSSLRLKCDIKKDTLLLCLSGGPNSFSLLKMATKAVQSNTLGKKMFFKIEVLYIDETVLYQNENQKVISFLDQNEYFFIFRLSYKVIKIEDIFDSNSDIVGE